ncbi:MAG: hypothetical protein AB7K04_08095 [Pseudorhodoplanes sp.]
MTAGVRESERSMQEKTRQQLADMIADHLKIDSAFVTVLADPERGWRPQIADEPGQEAALQGAADEIAQTLRKSFQLSAG